MKKTMLLLVSLFMLSLMSCSKDDDALSNVKQTWVFTITMVTSSSPAVEGYPMTVVTTVEEDNLTEAEAKAVAAAYSSTNSSFVPELGSTVTISITATYAAKNKS